MNSRKRRFRMTLQQARQSYARLTVTKNKAVKLAERSLEVVDKTLSSVNYDFANNAEVTAEVVAKTVQAAKLLREAAAEAQKGLKR